MAWTGRFACWALQGNGRWGKPYLRAANGRHCVLPRQQRARRVRSAANPFHSDKRRQSPRLRTHIYGTGGVLGRRRIARDVGEIHIGKRGTGRDVRHSGGRICRMLAQSLGNFADRSSLSVRNRFSRSAYSIRSLRRWRRKSCTQSLPIAMRSHRSGAGCLRGRHSIWRGRDACCAWGWCVMPKAAIPGRPPILLI